VKRLIRISVLFAVIAVSNYLPGTGRAAEQVSSSLQDGVPAEWVSQIMDIRSRVLAVRRGIEESRWHSTKPFRAKNLAVKFSPEDGVDLKERLGTGRKTKPFWNIMEWVDGQGVEVEWPVNTCVYLYRTIMAYQPTKLSVELGCDGGLQVFLNGQQVVSREKLDGPREKVALDLVKGRNELLVKIFRTGGTPVFHYSSGPVIAAELEKIGEKYQAQNLMFMKYFPSYQRWFCDDSNTKFEQQAILSVLQRMKSVDKEKAQLDELVKNKAPSSDPSWIKLLMAVAGKSAAFDDAIVILNSLNPKSMRLAINDLLATYQDKYRNGSTYLAKLDALEKDIGLGVADVSFAQVSKAAESLTWTRDPFDRMIVAHCMVADAELVSKDQLIRKHFSRAVW